MADEVDFESPWATAVDVIALRADVFRIALTLAREARAAGLDVDTDDAIGIAHFLVGPTT